MRPRWSAAGGDYSTRLPDANPCRRNPAGLNLQQPRLEELGSARVRRLCSSDKDTSVLVHSRHLTAVNHSPLD